MSVIGWAKKMKNQLKDELRLVYALEQSDDWAKHSKVMFEAAKQMVADGDATVEDFEINGGWIRKSKIWGIYFMYVGDDPNVKNRYYLNVRNGAVYQ